MIFLSVALALVLGELRERLRKPGRAGAAKRCPPSPVPAGAGGGRSRRRTPRVERRGALRGQASTGAAVVAVSAGYGFAVGEWGGAGWPVRAAVAVPGILAGCFAWRQRVAADRGSPPAGSWMWACAAVLAGLLELTSYLLQQERTPERFYNHPTASIFIAPLVASEPGKAVGLAVWLAGGYLLLRRAWAAGTQLSPADAGEAAAGDADGGEAR